MEIKSVLREITLNQGEWFIHWRADFSPGPQRMNWQRTTGSSTKILINVSAVRHEKPTQYYRLVAGWLGNTSTERKKMGIMVESSSTWGSSASLQWWRLTTCWLALARFWQAVCTKWLLGKLWGNMWCLVSSYRVSCPCYKKTDLHRGQRSANKLAGFLHDAWFPMLTGWGNSVSSSHRSKC